MLSTPFRLTALPLFSSTSTVREMFARALRPNFAAVSGLRQFSVAAKAKAAAVESATEVVVRKSNVKHSPLRMKFLAMLIRDTWLPDALAQLKFSPKHKAVDLAKMVKVHAPSAYGNFACRETHSVTLLNFFTERSGHCQVKLRSYPRRVED